MDLSSEQAEACDIIFSILGTSQREAVLQGPAGTGKTVTTAALIRRAQKEGYVCAVAAPTHKACGVLRERLRDLDVNVGVSTIHAATGKRPDPDDRERLAKAGHPLARNADVLFVDEASMVSAQLVSAARGLQAKNIVWIGDRYQLPPVNERQSLAFVSQDVVAELREVRRYQASEYMTKTTEYLRACIDQGKPPKLELVRKNFVEHMGEGQFHGGGFDKLAWLAINRDVVAIGHKNATVDAVNERAYDMKHGTDFYDWREGERVTFQRAYEVAKGYRVTNGTEVIIREAESNGEDPWSLMVSTEKDSPTVLHVFAYHPQIGSEMAAQAKMTQDKKLRHELERPAWLRYQWASTIHKAQGSTMPGVAIYWPDIVSAPQKDVARLLYVALTRASDIEQLHLVID
jgi:exodeoxyribonuclease-5